MSLRILTADDIKNVLTMQDAIHAMREAFTQLALGKVAMPLRTVIPVPEHQGVALFMPAYLPDLEQLGVKIVSSYPTNIQQGLKSIYGLIILLDTHTGQPQAILDGAHLTALRTGAVSGLATDLLARKNASSVSLIGSGVQAKTQLEAVNCVRKINQVWIYTRTFQNAENFAQELSESNSLSCTINVTDSLHEATKDADIICTTTPATAPIVELKNIKPGAHINAIGSHSKQMSELSTDLLSHARIIVDEREAALKEAGEIIQCINKNLLAETDLIELGTLINHPYLGRQTENQITIFKSVGLAIQDVAVAQHAFKKALEKNQGTLIKM
jgi:ornithine cyclodeaminase